MGLKERKEIEDQLAGMNPFMQLEFLEKMLKKTETFDVKSFIHTKLAEIYSKRGMFAEAAKNMENGGEIAVTFREKREEFMKAIEIYIKAGDYGKIDIVLNKALSYANESEKPALKEQRKKMMVEQAERFEKDGKNNNALKMYELLFRIVNEQEREIIKNKMIPLYERLGKIREANALKIK